MNTVNTTCSNTGGGPGARSANQHAMSVTTMISPSRISPIDFNLFTSEEWDRFFEASEGFKYSPTVTISRLSPCFGGGSSANTPTTGTQDPTKEYALLRTLPVNESAEFARVEKLVQAEKEIEALKEQNIALQNRYISPSGSFFSLYRWLGLMLKSIYRVANLEREVTVDITLQSRYVITVRLFFPFY